VIDIYVNLRLIKKSASSIFARLFNRNTAGAYILQAEKALFAFIVLPLLASRLGISVFGTFCTFLSLSVISGAVVDWGFSLTAVQSVAISKSSEKSHIAGAVILARLILTIPVALIVLVLCYCTSALNGHLILGVCTILTIYTASLSPLFIFLAEEKSFEIGIVLLAARLTACLLIFAVIKTPEDLNLAFYIYLLFIYLGVGAGWLVLVYKFKFRINFASVGAARRLIAVGSDFASANIGSSLYGNGSVFLLSLVSSGAQVGMFSLALTLTRGICSVLAPVSQSYLPKISLLFEESFEKARNAVRKALVLQSLMACILVVMVWIVFIFLIPVDTYHKVPGLSMLVIILSPTIVFTLISSMLVLFVIIPLKATRFYKNLVVFSSSSSSACLLILGYFFQGYGAAIAILMTETIICFAIFNHSMKLITSKID